MKKIFLLALASAFALNASAEGYQVNTLSAKQLGMGHTGVSQKLNSESVWFNPAAAAYQEQRFTIAGGVTGIKSKATYEGVNASTGETEKHTSDNDLSTPIYFNANFKVTENLAVGVNFNTPYGSSMNWGDNWAGAHLIQNISLQSYNLQPTVSYKLLDGKLSIGAGLMMSWGSVELSKSLFPIGEQSNTTLTAVSGVDFTGVGDNPLGSISMSGETKMAYGVNVGVMYDLCKMVSIGASYRSKMMMKIDAGDTGLGYYNDTVAAVLGKFDSVATMENGTFAAELPLPSTLSVGVTVSPISKLKVSAEMQMVGWSSYESLDFLFTADGYEPYANNSAKNYENTFIYRLGAELGLTKSFKVRAGIYYDESPVVSTYFAPETPSMDKIGYTCGLSFNPSFIPNLSVDLAYGFISPASHDRSASYTSLDGLQGAAYLGYATAAASATDVATATYLTGLADDAASKMYNVFEGKYRAVAHTFSVGLSWGF